MLTAGTLYAFSLYASELSLRLGLNQKQIAVIGSFGNYGNYFSAPFVGFLVEKVHPRVMVIAGGVMLTIGYTSVAYLLPPEGSPPPSNPPLLLLTLAFVLIGSGSAALYITPLSVNVKNASLRWKGLIVGVSVGCFGLSALVMSFIKNLWFPTNTKDFLIVVGLVGGLVNLISSLGLQIVKRSDLLITSGEGLRYHTLSDNEPPQNSVDDLRTLIAADEVSSNETDNSVDSEQKSRCVYKEMNSWLFFLLFSLSTGSGLMYINNLGAIVYSLLWAKGHRDDDIMFIIAKEQAFYVGLLSFFNCSGRIVTGIFTDATLRKVLALAVQKNRRSLLEESNESTNPGLIDKEEEMKISKILRGWILSASLLLMCVGQYIAGKTTEMTPWLNVSTVCIGLAYGSAFATAPAFASDMWGSYGFGVNW
jgi:hypothetical protein